MGVLCCCFHNLTSKSLEILPIVFQSVCLILLFCCIGIIKWSNLSIANIFLFSLMLIITILIIIFTSFIRYWRSKNLIKTTKKMRGQCFASICFGLIIACFVICIIEEFVITFEFKRADFPCHKTNFGNPEKSSNYNYYYYYRKNRILANYIDCYSLGPNYYADVITDREYLISYITFTYLEFSFILGIWILYILRRRIIQGLDGPLPENMQQVMYDQYGRQVIIQQGNVVIVDGKQNPCIPGQNQNNNQSNQSNNIINHSNNQFNNLKISKFIDNNNIGSSQNISNQMSDVRNFNLQEKLH